MAALGAALAWLLAVASKRLHVYEDPRIEEVESLLPKSNCGACGTAGCRNFAEELVAGHTEPARCTVNSSDMNEYIASVLGVDMGDVEKRVARLACAGGRHVARMRAHYAGLGSCRAATTVAGGGKACDWGCLGLGDCESVCDFNAISMNQYGLPVVDPSKCTACGDCVEICPKGLFSLEPVSRKLWVACKNHADGDTAALQCEVSCTACGKCVADAAPGLMRLNNNLAAIDYSKNALATSDVIARCPTGAIVWMDSGRATRGVAAKKIVRISALPVASEV
ncbi:4Fe-4S dicluster domain-containing protein [Parasulfuritortus cantonensis]|uniref:Ion-translocating oxidoreductase complex subunit B n=2 Tax=Parasulfuritortus cantonensis TaxID=2528202 RepID=A0A4R1BFK7_9PROT|nr:4Fe-4S dicluster domain-containing protein [Parasulfuritortus cantonensis]